MKTSPVVPAISILLGLVAVSRGMGASWLVAVIVGLAAGALMYALATGKRDP
jgi:hypothetical protein